MAMQQLFEMDVVTLSAYATVIIVLKELVEFVFTKNLPWLSRLVRNGVRRVKRVLWKRSNEDGRFLVLNFSGHPVLSGQQKAIQKRMGWPKLEVIDVPMGTIAEDENFLKIAILKVDGIDLLPD